jgi:hypothetical protein
MLTLPQWPVNVVQTPGNSTSIGMFANTEPAACPTRTFTSVPEVNSICYSNTLTLGNSQLGFLTKRSLKLRCSPTYRDCASSAATIYLDATWHGVCLFCIYSYHVVPPKRRLVLPTPNTVRLKQRQDKFKTFVLWIILRLYSGFIRTPLKLCIILRLSWIIALRRLISQH